MNQSIGFEDILIFEQTFDASPLNRVAENAVTRVGIGEAAVSHDAPAINQHEFSIDVESGKVTDQKRSGRCWKDIPKMVSVSKRLETSPGSGEIKKRRIRIMTG